MTNRDQAHLGGMLENKLIHVGPSGAVWFGELRVSGHTVIVGGLLVVSTWDSRCLSSSLRRSDLRNGPKTGCEQAMPVAERTASYFRKTKPVRNLSWSLKHLLSGKTAKFLRSKRFGLRTF